MTDWLVDGCDILDRVGRGSLSDACRSVAACLLSNDQAERQIMINWLARGNSANPMRIYRGENNLGMGRFFSRLFSDILQGNFKTKRSLNWALPCVCTDLDMENAFTKEATNDKPFSWTINTGPKLKSLTLESYKKHSSQNTNFSFKFEYRKFFSINIFSRLFRHDLKQLSIFVKLAKCIDFSFKKMTHVINDSVLIYPAKTHL